MASLHRCRGVAESIAALQVRPSAFQPCLAIHVLSALPPSCNHRDYNSSELTTTFLMGGVDPSSVRSGSGILQLAPGELPDLVSTW